MHRAQLAMSADMVEPVSCWDITSETTKIVIRWFRGETIPPGLAAMVDNVTGEYQVSGLHHGRMMYRKVAGPSGMRCWCYYVSESEPADMQGWWLSPEPMSQLFYASNPAKTASVPHTGWRRHDVPLCKLMAIPKIVDMGDELSELQRKHAQVIQEKRDLESEYDKLETKNQTLWTSYKNLLADTKGQPHKVPRVVPPPTGMHEPVETACASEEMGGSSSSTGPSASTGGSAASGSGAPYTGPGEPRTRARTRGGVRVQAQRIVDMFVTGSYDELANTHAPGRLHW